MKADTSRGLLSMVVTGAEREAWCAWDDSMGLGDVDRGGFPGAGSKVVLILIVERWV